MERRLLDRCRTSLRCCSSAPRAWIFVTSYKGNPQAITDLIGGHLPMHFTSTQDLVEAHKAGRIRVLATSGRERSTALPEVPTFTESGYGIRGEGWHGIYAPARTPVEVVAKLNRAVVEAVRTDEFSKRLTPLGVQPTGTSAEEFSRFRSPIPNCGGLSSRLLASSRSRKGCSPEIFRADCRIKRGRPSRRPLRTSSPNQRFCWASATAPGISVVTARSPIFFPISFPASVEKR
jgi:hypothetical protein